MVMETVEAAERSEELVEPGLTSQPGQVTNIENIAQGTTDPRVEFVSQVPHKLQFRNLE